MSDEKILTIIVNGREKVYTEKTISFEKLIEIAFGKINTNQNAVYTVTYSKNDNKSGVMVQGDTVKVHKGAIFNVTRTDKS